jgi:DNA-binding transcriptional regulator YiaG
MMEKPRRSRHHAEEMAERVRRLLAEAEAWCDQERGRRTQLANYLGTTLQAVSAWFREYRKPRPAKQPTAEQALGIREFLESKRA